MRRLLVVALCLLPSLRTSATHYHHSPMTWTTAVTTIVTSPPRLCLDFRPPAHHSVLHALSVLPFGYAEVLLPLALPTFCSLSPAFISVSPRNSPTSNLSTWPCRTGTVSSPILARPRRLSPPPTSTLSLPFDFNFGTVTAGLSTAGSVFLGRSSTLHLVLPARAIPPSRPHPPVRLAHPPLLSPSVLP